MDINEHSELGWAYIVLYHDLGMCGCGMLDARIELLKSTLEAMPLHTPKPGIDVGYLNTPLGEWFLSILDHGKLIDHGSAISGSWLTPKGERFLKAIEDLEAFQDWCYNEGMCVCPECSELWS